jgi:uracil-DNA glycosylase family 4
VAPPTALEVLRDEIVGCRMCPRLVAWRERVAAEKRRAYRDQTYWGRPVPGFGDPLAPLIVVGLAPAAHGANRTGRMFTGDRSGDFLYAALHRAGFASQAESRSADDGLLLRGVYITAPCRCAPPDNKPAPDELAACRGFLERELALLERARVYLALGKIGYDAVASLARRRDKARDQRQSIAPFGHGVVARIPDPRLARSSSTSPPGEAILVGSYHVSQQNTQTGRLTPAMFDGALAKAARLAGLLGSL